MTAICPLFSGSNGNCTYIEGGAARLIVDAGVSGRRIAAALLRIDRRAEDLNGILVTHEHIDHIAGVGVMARRYGLTVYLTEGTYLAVRAALGNVGDVKIIKPGERFEIRDLTVEAFEIPHDAEAPVGYSFYDRGKKISVATDIGEMSERLFLSLSGSDAVLLESNHDVRMLENGAYPYHLKQRIRGGRGHLSNDEAAAACARLVSLGTRRILLGHLSGENNRPHLAYDTARGFIARSGAKIGTDVLLSVAERGVTGELAEI